MTQPAPAVNGPRTLVLDVDGTLLDTVYLHVIASELLQDLEDSPVGRLLR